MKNRTLKEKWENADDLPPSYEELFLSFVAFFTPCLDVRVNSKDVVMVYGNKI